MSAIWWIVMIVLVGILGFIIVDGVMTSCYNEERFWNAIDEMTDEDDVNIIIWY